MAALVIAHGFTCGCVMHEGDRRSRHASGDYRDTSCAAHAKLPKHVWPHHVDARTERIPPLAEREGDLLFYDVVLKRAGVNV